MIICRQRAIVMIVLLWGSFLHAQGEGILRIFKNSTEIKDWKKIYVGSSDVIYIKFIGDEEYKISNISYKVTFKSLPKEEKSDLIAGTFIAPANAEERVDLSNTKRDIRSLIREFDETFKKQHVIKLPVSQFISKESELNKVKYTYQQLGKITIYIHSILKHADGQVQSVSNAELVGNNPFMLKEGITFWGGERD